MLTTAGREYRSPTKMDKQLKGQTDRKREILKGTVRHTRADIQPERDKETERIGKQTG